MGAKHSPGPWEAVDSLTVRGPFEAGNHEKAGFLIASLPAYRSTGDAKLIAAAPELLEALIAVVDFIEGKPGAPEPFGAVRDAIAKATGGVQ